MKKARPVGNKIVVERVEAEEKSEGGIVLPDVAKGKPLKGKVLAVGPGDYQDGKRCPLDVAEGDMVLFKPYSGTEFKLEGKQIVIMSIDDVACVIEDDKRK